MRETFPLHPLSPYSSVVQRKGEGGMRFLNTCLSDRNIASFLIIFSQNADYTTNCYNFAAESFLFDSRGRENSVFT